MRGKVLGQRPSVFGGAAQCFAGQLDALGGHPGGGAHRPEAIPDLLPHADYVHMINLGQTKAAGPAAEFTEARVTALIQECLLG